MNVLVNGTTLNGKAYAERDTVTGIITCTVIVPQSEIDYADVKALFKGNTEDIIHTKEDGSTELFSGFTYKNTLDDDENNQYIIKLTANEYVFQLGRNRELEADKATLESTVASKDSEISTLNATISKKDKVITEREETIATLETEIVELKNSVGDVDLSEFASALEEGVNDYE